MPSGTLAPIGADQDFPLTVREYAEATVGAWAAPDLGRLADLATPEVHAALVELPGPPDPRWSLVECDDTGVEVGCAFYNSEGDELVVWVERTGLGAPRAAVAVDFDPTSFPDDPLAYVAEFLDAWRAGNLARMRMLAAPTVVEVYRTLSPEAEPGFEAAEDNVIVVTLDGADIVTEVDPTRLGEPRAIVSARRPAA